MAAGNRQVTASTVFRPVPSGQPVEAYMWNMKGTGANRLVPFRVAQGHYQVELNQDTDPFHTSITAYGATNTVTQGVMNAIERGIGIFITRNRPTSQTTTVDIFVTRQDTNALVDDPVTVEVSFSRLPE